MVKGVAFKVDRRQLRGMERLHGLDALRGIAAGMVFLFHLRAFGAPIPGLPFNLGVDIFFVLSGFVITRTYEVRLREGMTTPQFIRVRYRRLWVPGAVGVLLGLCVYLTRNPMSEGVLLAAAMMLLLLPTPRGDFFLNLPAWSLFAELFCNVSHALALKRASNLILGAVLAAGVILLIAGTMIVGDPWGQNPIATLVTLPRAVIGYLAGVLVYRMWGDAPLGNRPVLALALCPLAVIALTPLADGPKMAITSLIIGPLVLRGVLSLRASPWATWVGDASYPFYAVQMPILMLSGRIGLPAAACMAVLAGIGLARMTNRGRPMAPTKASAQPLNQVLTGKSPVGTTCPPSDA